MREKTPPWLAVNGPILLAVLFIVATLSGCGSSPDDDAPPTSVITLSSEKTFLPADGESSTKITATLTQSNDEPVKEGTEVVFQTTLGRFSNGQQVFVTHTIDDEGLTDDREEDLESNGIVSVSLIAGTTPGTATVTVTSSGVSQSLQLPMGVAGGSIELSADPVTIPADGASTTTITAYIYNADGTPALIGTPVTFRTDYGRFNNGQRTQTLAAVQLGSETGAQVFLTSTEEPHTVKVTCTAMGTTRPITVYFEEEEAEEPPEEDVTPPEEDVTLESAVPQGAIHLTADPAHVPADGISRLTVRAFLTDAAGQPVPMGTPVFFETTLGVFANGLKETQTVTATPDGEAGVTLFSGLTPGSAVVTAGSNGVQKHFHVAFTPL